MCKIILVNLRNTALKESNEIDKQFKSVKGCRNNKICMKNIETMRTSNLKEKLVPHD